MFADNRQEGMSINVTVNGNPVKIKRGTMVTADSDYAKKELDKRRKIRLTQVRQQSNEIAAKVRKRVQKERGNQLSELEKKGEEKLERWKMRKLLELQEQYCDSLKNLGLGHAGAAFEESRDHVEQCSKDLLKAKSKQRGFDAAKKLHEEQMEKKEKVGKVKKVIKPVGDGHKPDKGIKSPFKKKKKRKKSLQSRNQSKNSSFSEESDFSVTEQNVSDHFNSDKEEEAKRLSDIPSSRHYEDQEIPSKENKSVPSSSSVSPVQEKRSTLKSPSPPRLADIMIHHPADTRISDRIKNRRLPPFKDPILGDSFSTNQLPVLKDQTKILVSTGTLTDEDLCPCCFKCNCLKRNYQVEKDFDKVDAIGTSKNVGTITDTNLFPSETHTLTCICCPCKNKLKTNELKKCICQSEIPSKPTVALKGVKKSKFGDVDKVQYYDHQNRFAKEYVPMDSKVQKIPESDIEVLPTSRSEKELMEESQRRDKEAQIRGKKAMEKQKIQKDYKELMEKLPALQRQERIASINTKNSHNPMFHMSDSRLKEQELKKQCRMEDAYERLFPHSVTLKPKIRNVDDKPFRVTNMKDASAGSVRWDVGCGEEDGVTVTKDDGVITINPNVQTDNLKSMLEKLKRQKELLLKEVETLPRDSNLNSIIDDLESFRNTNQRPRTPPNSLRKDISASDYLDHLTKLGGFQQEKKSPKRTRLRTTSSSEDTNRRRKKFHKIQKIILQNTSTQTSPKVTQTSPKVAQPISDQSKEESVLKKAEKEKKIRKKLTKSGQGNKIQVAQSVQVPSASCSKLAPCNENIVETTHTKSCKCDKDGICEIVIKIQDDVPEINIKSPSKPKLVEKSPKPDDKIVPEPTSTQKLDKVPKEDKVPKTSIQEPKKASIRKKPIVLDKKNKLSWDKTLSTPPEPSTSTSYYSPPDFQKSGVGSSQPSKVAKRELLLKYIKRLLGMSRGSIENLAVSAGSDISLESTLSALSGSASAASLALKILDLSIQDTDKNIYQTSTSLSEGLKSTDYDASISNNNNKAEDEVSSKGDVTDTRLAAVAERYQCMADQCQKRISDLTAMIQQVRKEKEQILSPTFNEKEGSTAYLSLPSTLGEESKKSPSPVSDVSESEQEQRILNKLLLDVNVNLEKIREQGLAEFPSKSSETPPSIDSEVYERYKKLVHVEASKSTLSKSEVVITEIETTKKNADSFTPMIDIPRLPKLGHTQIYTNITDEDNKVKKPPPAKGIIAAKKFSEDITSVPHELSTILEVDSQLSTKEPSPQKRDALLFTSKDKEKEIAEESMPDIVAELKSSESMSSTSDLNEKQKTDQSASSDMENLEGMLVSMGMGWAVATLRKTQEALMKATSSTSSEDGQKPKDTSDSTTSDVTLRDILGKKLFSTSTTMSSSNSMSPFIRELEEISVIHGSGLSGDKRQQRTSTPNGQYEDKSIEKSTKKGKKVHLSLPDDYSKATDEEVFATIPMIESPGSSSKKS